MRKRKYEIVEGALLRHLLLTISNTMSSGVGRTASARCCMGIASIRKGAFANIFFFRHIFSLWYFFPRV